MNEENTELPQDSEENSTRSVNRRASHRHGVVRRSFLKGLGMAAQPYCQPVYY